MCLPLEEHGVSCSWWERVSALNTSVVKTRKGSRRSDLVSRAECLTYPCIGKEIMCSGMAVRFVTSKDVLQG